jgi:hypothetical protein
MIGLNRALKNYEQLNQRRLEESISVNNLPCIFISYQRQDEDFARVVSDYVNSKQIDTYFYLEDNDLRLTNQRKNPLDVTNAIRKGIIRCGYMIVIVSPNTYKSLWVPFEIGFAFDKMENDMKILQHKGIEKSNLPDYLKIKEMLQGFASLNIFLRKIQSISPIYERLAKQNQNVGVFSSYNSNSLQTYLENE